MCGLVAHPHGHTSYKYRRARHYYHMLSRVSRCSASAVLGAALGVALGVALLATAGWGRLPGLQPAAICGGSPGADDELALTVGSAATPVRAMGSAARSGGGAGDCGSRDDPCDINAFQTLVELLLKAIATNCNGSCCGNGSCRRPAPHTVLRPVSCFGIQK